MKICIIASNYPAEGYPKHVFLEKIVKEFVDKGHICTVIAPQAKSRKGYPRQLHKKYYSDKGKAYDVYSPVYTNFSGRKIGPFNLGLLTQKSFRKSIDKIYRENNIECDVFYSHFLPAGTAANVMSQKYDIPFFMANGESELKAFIDTLPAEDVKETYKNVSGIISVSTANKNETLTSGFFPEGQEEKIIVLPNAVNSEVFFQENRLEARKKLGFNKNIFIISFVGSFSERKGSIRVANALKKCEDVYSVFIGSGNEEPVHDKCLFKGRVDNQLVRTYLSASDVFVLPTLNEGCCNAIVEALACGLPVISSDRDFNYDILNASCAVLIDPNDESAIAEAIMALKADSTSRRSKSIAALKMARDLNLDNRSRKIIEIMENVVCKK